MSRYESSTPRSRELFNLAQRFLPGGVSYSIRYFEPYPFYVSRAAGQKLWDVDGNMYTDYWIGHGAKIMGHSYPPVIETIRKQIELGIHVGLPHEWEIKLAEQIRRMVPSVEKIRFTNSGTEANMYAVRLARAYTKRSSIIKFEGNWHGGYDALHIAVSPPYEKLYAGLTSGAVKDTVVLPYNNLEAVEKAVEKIELAGIIVEPVAGAGGMIPAEREFLKGLRELCDKVGALLIFDEVKTCGKWFGGVEERYGVKPDLKTLGKAIGGGIPLSALGGRREIMELFGPGKVSHAGTFNANPLSVKAGIVTLEKILTREAISNAIKLGEQLAKGYREIIVDYGIDAIVSSIGVSGAIFFTNQPQVKNYRELLKCDFGKWFGYFISMLNRGIIPAATGPDEQWTISVQHTLEDVEKHLEAFKEVAPIIKKVEQPIGVVEAV